MMSASASARTGWISCVTVGTHGGGESEIESESESGVTNGGTIHARKRKRRGEGSVWRKSGGPGGGCPVSDS
jgi:hypothetical protein